MAEPKRIRRRLGAFIFPVLGRWFFSGLHRSCRWTLIGREQVAALEDAGRPFLCATWHFDLISVIYHFRGSRAAIMVSPSRDGEFIARLIERWGYTAVRGSKHKGGLDAAKEMIGLAKKGRIAGIAADGSQGPARRAQKGAVFIARAAQVPLVPAIVAAKRQVRLNTWDQTQLPWPFTRLAMFFGRPVLVPPKNEGKTLEESRLELERTLNELCRRAEEHQW